MFSYKIDTDAELRLLEHRHARVLWEMIDGNRAHLQPWIPWIDGIESTFDTRMYISRCLEDFAENRGFQAGLWYRGDLAGSLGHVNLDWTDRTAEVGYWLGTPYQGKGLMTRACRAVVQHAFSDLQLNRVEIACALENEKGHGIPRRLGFVQEGVARQAEWLHTRFVDHVVYAMLAQDWADQSRP